MKTIDDLCYGYISLFVQCAMGDKRLNKLLKSAVRNRNAHGKAEKTLEIFEDCIRYTALPSMMHSHADSGLECSFWLKPSLCPWVRMNNADNRSG